MRWIAASLAAVLAATALGGCGGGGAEPDAPAGGVRELTLVLDFQPNAVHSGIYVAEIGRGLSERGVELEIVEPSGSSDAPKLLEAGRADLAILDINDLGIARERGLDLVAIGAIVQRPLAAVIAADAELVRAPDDLAGARVGVTGLPSDDAVLDSVLRSGGVDPGSVDRTTIGFESVPLLAAGRVDAATAFWNAEGIALRQRGVPTREFRVDDFGAPRYPELVLATTAEGLAQDEQSIEAVVAALAEGYATVTDDPVAGLDALLAAVPGLEEDSQRAQLEALLESRAFSPPLLLERHRIEAWATWAEGNGILKRPLDVEDAFLLDR